MGHAYRSVGWNRQKRVYDLTLATGVAVYLALFSLVALAVHPEITVETLLIRAFGTLAFLLLNVTLSIGPLARLEPRLLPLLYNRRHLGVATFLAALVHALLSLVQFHSWGDLAPPVSLLVSNGAYSDLAFFPFQVLGLAALGILFLMAATSHDFWLEVLSPAVWKSLHMAVYLAYLLLVGHIALGALQAETHPGLVVVMTASVVWLAGLHIAAGLRERRTDHPQPSVKDESGADTWVDVGPAASIEDGRAKVVRTGDERVAVFRDGERLFALGNVCAHQAGPLGEGRVRDGCAVCPWHGYEYRLESGKSPPPFEERVPVYCLRLREGRVEVHGQPLAAGTPLPSVTTDATGGPSQGPFYIGYEAEAPPAISRTVRHAAVTLLATTGLLAAGLAAWQEPFSTSVFNYGVETTIVGTLATEPLPHLLVVKDERLSLGSYLVVQRGKHGYDPPHRHGSRVRITGSAIYNSIGQMIEVHSVESGDPGPPYVVPPIEDLGRVVVEGEIVDAKCWLGVMKPGRKKTHRACASLCIRGGIPAMLLAEVDGLARALVLVPEAGRSVGSDLLDRLAEPVRIDGRLSRRANLWFLHYDPGSIERLHPPQTR